MSSNKSSDTHSNSSDSEQTPQIAELNSSPNTMPSTRLSVEEKNALFGKNKKRGSIASNLLAPQKLFRSSEENTIQGLKTDITNLHASDLIKIALNLNDV